jgi:WD40 repeat protein
MTAIEDRLRAATRAAADTVAPGSAPPLRLPGPGHDRGRPGRSGRGRRWAGWAAPLVAAAAVAAVIAGVLTVSKLAFHPPSPRTSPADRAGLVTVQLRRAPAAANGAIPAYVVGLAPGPLAAQSTRAVVRAAASGTALAILSPPRGYGSFTWITGAADDRTFVLAAYGRGPAPTARNATAFFLLRLDPAAGTAWLSPLPVPAQPDLPGMGSPVSGIALSPDGGQLAVALGNQSGPSELKLFDLHNGSVRVWRGGRGARIDGYISADELGANPLSWTADGRTLAVDQWVGLTVNVRLLDTSAPGSDLWSGRRAAMFPNWPSGSVAGSAIITPDGTKIIAMAVTRHATQIQLNEFSTSTGRPVGTVVRLHYRPGAITGWPNVLWSDSSGSTLIVKTTRLGTGRSQHGDLTPEMVGVVIRGHFTPLPGIPAGNMLAW